MALIISIFSMLVVVILLLKEQVALLYLLSTLGVTAVLLVVAFADLKGEGQTTKNAENPHVARASRP